MLDREKVLAQAVHNCYKEMFAKAQPEADWDNLVEEFKSGKLTKDANIYDRHYLSFDEYNYILNKYMNAYRIKGEWEDNIEVLETYLKEGGTKEKYIDEYTDEYGNYHPGTRGYEKVAPLKEHIYDIIYGEYDGNGEIAEDVTNKVVDKVMEIIKMCKNFYCFNMDEQKFRNTLALGATPTSNIETVKKWWKDHYDIDVEIEERNPMLLWEMDYYGDNFEEVMEDEYGENWKADWDKIWEEEKAAKKAEHEERLKKIREDYKTSK